MGIDTARVRLLIKMNSSQMFREMERIQSQYETGISTKEEREASLANDLERMGDVFRKASGFYVLSDDFQNALDIYNSLSAVFAYEPHGSELYKLSIPLRR